jgi:16S rRNA (cytidine1402-2'-O)-methyltransferase
MEDVTSTLYIIATPIGHLADISTRAVETIISCDIILCEDTRTTKKLFHLLGIKPEAKFIAYHDHNESKLSPNIIEQMKASPLTVGLLSDAGTPCLSDPGYRIVCAARESNIPVFPIPGPSSITALLSVCGLPVDRFQFVGFLPRSKNALEKEVSNWNLNPMSYVFLESPHRIQHSIGLMQKVLGNWHICLGRELTKIHEEYFFSTLDLFDSTTLTQKGEYIGVVAPSEDSQAKPSEKDLDSLIRTSLEQGKSASDICESLSGLGYSKKAIYSLVLKHKAKI